MTFNVRTKIEMTDLDPYTGCCAASHLCGMLVFAKEFSSRRILISTEHDFIIRYIYGQLVDFGVHHHALDLFNSKHHHTLTISDPSTIERLMNDFGYMGDEVNLRVNEQNFLCDRCASAFISGCFISGGSVTDPQRNYHLEFVTHRGKLLADVAHILSGAGFLTHMATRGYAKILYFKNSTEIEDLLTYMGAVSSSLALMDTKIYKEISNAVNRRVNCENANIDKIVNSSTRDRRAIQTILNEVGKENFPDDLLEVAQLRLRHPELPLTEIGGLLDKPLTKSGVLHRLRRIRQAAEGLKEKKNVNPAK